MKRPRVTVHNMVSLDGRTDHFAGDLGLYYQLAARIPHDAVLSGSSTLIAAAAAQGIDLDGEDSLPAEDAVRTTAGSADAPLLVIVDGRGRLTRFDWLTGVPYWRDLLVACSTATPAGHRELLARRKLPHAVVGNDRVDLARLLELLAAEHGIEQLRVDSGGELNGALLRAGLVDEISVVVAPYVVGGRTPAALFVADDLASDVTQVTLSGLERQPGDAVWLRFEVAHAPAA